MQAMLPVTKSSAIFKLFQLSPVCSEAIQSLPFTAFKCFYCLLQDCTSELSCDAFHIKQCIEIVILSYTSEHEKI